MNCQDCGADLPSGAKFCLKCGSEVSKQRKVGGTYDQRTSAPAREHQPAQPARSKSRGSPYGTPRVVVEEVTRQEGCLKIILALLIVSSVNHLLLGPEGFIVRGDYLLYDVARIVFSVGNIICALAIWNNRKWGLYGLIILAALVFAANGRIDIGWLAFIGLLIFLNLEWRHTAQ